VWPTGRAGSLASVPASAAGAVVAAALPQQAPDEVAAVVAVV